MDLHIMVPRSQVPQQEPRHAGAGGDASVRCRLAPGHSLSSRAAVQEAVRVQGSGSLRFVSRIYAGSLRLELDLVQLSAVVGLVSSLLLAEWPRLMFGFGLEESGPN